MYGSSSSPEVTVCVCVTSDTCCDALLLLVMKQNSKIQVAAYKNNKTATWMARQRHLHVCHADSAHFTAEIQYHQGLAYMHEPETAFLKPETLVWTKLPGFGNTSTKLPSICALKAAPCRPQKLYNRTCRSWTDGIKGDLNQALVSIDLVLHIVVFINCYLRFSCAMLCIAHTVLLQDVCLSVTCRYSSEAAERIIKLFSLSGSHTILIFPYQTV